MKKFMDDNFLLNTQTAAQLFYNYAENLPVIDYHCHINPEEIAKDKKIENIAEAWLGGDHYKWRLMRAAGVDEEYITGNAAPREKFQKYAQVICRCIGNPVFHWTHLELQRYFGYYGILSEDTAEEVWRLCNEKLQGMTAKSIIKRSNVELICTTDDPADSLEWHAAIAEDKSFDVKVLPAWRPDNAVYIEKSAFGEYFEKLGNVGGAKIKTYSDLLTALSNRMDFFETMGCKTADHGLDYVDYLPASFEKIEEIFKKRLNGGILSETEIRNYKTEILLFLGYEYSKRNWVMQLHYGCKRDNNPVIFEKQGINMGCDCISNYTPSALLADFLGALERKNTLPQTILYSLNPNDNAVIDTIAGCFQGNGTINKIQHGSAWWFNDNIDGMSSHLKSLANGGYLPGFVGMLTDSRSFLSYPRHEYFRRILCNFIGDLVENGEYPADMNLLSKIVSDISYNNVKSYFNF